MRYIKVIVPVPRAAEIRDNELAKIIFPSPGGRGLRGGGS
jgi:hypothetical protein